jgi:hypothetical protein
MYEMPKIVLKTKGQFFRQQKNKVNKIIYAHATCHHKFLVVFELCQVDFTLNTNTYVSCPKFKTKHKK